MLQENSVFSVRSLLSLTNCPNDHLHYSNGQSVTPFRNTAHAYVTKASQVTAPPDARLANTVTPAVAGTFDPQPRLAPIHRPSRDERLGWPLGAGNDRELNPVPSDYKSGVLTTTLPRPLERQPWYQNDQLAAHYKLGIWLCHRSNQVQYGGWHTGHTRYRKNSNNIAAILKPRRVGADRMISYWFLDS
jgi:hypothetical protein